MNMNQRQHVQSIQTNADNEYSEGWAAFDAGIPLNPAQPKKWQHGWSDNETNTAVNEADFDVEFRAHRKLRRLAKNGSHRTKVLIRKSSRYTSQGVIALVQAARAARTSQ